MRQRSRAGFTLIELMVTVGIMGILSATAIPSFAGMVARSKTAEVSGNLNSMFKLSAAYYASERSAQGNNAGVSGFCTVDDAGPLPTLPMPHKQTFGGDANFQSLGFALADLTYFSYGLAVKNGLGNCVNVPNTPDLYTFYAHGDLDGDSTMSTFELSAGSDGTNVLYHSHAFFIDREIE
jgi:prepilin-type N-terminal cleavage/methylation domain-containing protein